jgi:geranylgeranyl pyrophosphate synthase
MIGGQYLDVTGSATDLVSLNRLKTGRLFEASVLVALGVSGSEPQTWRTFAQDVGALFQLVDDLLDGDGFVVAHGVEETRRLAESTAERALDALTGVDSDTTVLEGLVESLATRTA